MEKIALIGEARLVGGGDGSMTTSGNEPEDAIRMRQLLDSMGVQDYEPRVVHQLLDFMYGYVSGVLQDAEAYSERGGEARGSVEVEDVLTAIQARAAFSFVQPPSQDILAALAEKRNAQPLPDIGKAHGLRLPPEDACLTAPTWQLPRPPAPPPQPPQQPQRQRSPAAAGASGGSGEKGVSASGPSSMDVDSVGGGYPLPAAQQNGGGSRPRPPLDVNPGEAPDD